MKNKPFLISVLILIATFACGLIIIDGYHFNNNNGKISFNNNQANLNSLNASISPILADYNHSVKLGEKGIAQFPDGLIITLAKIQDSRCKTGQQCVWQGQLSAHISATGGALGNSSNDLQFSSTGNVELQLNTYKISSISVDENGITFTVSKTEKTKLKPIGFPF